MKSKYAIFDIDDTLSIVGDRVKLLDQDPPDWEGFLDRVEEDECNLPVAQLLSIMHGDLDTCVIILTARGEEHRAHTERWLYKYNLPTDYLIMRKLGDRRPDVMIKLELLDELDPDWPEKTILAVDDRQTVITAMKARGVVSCVKIGDSPDRDAFAAFRDTVTTGVE